MNKLLFVDDYENKADSPHIDHTGYMLNNDNFLLSSRASFSSDLIETLESRLGVKNNKTVGNIGNVNFDEMFKIMAYLESGGRADAIGDSGTSFGPTQVHGPYFISALSRQPNVEQITGLSSNELKEMANEWKNSLYAIRNENIWKYVPVNQESIKNYIKENPKSVVSRAEGTFVRYPEMIIIKKDGQFVGKTFDLDRLANMGLNVNSPATRRGIENIFNTYVTDNVAKSTLAQLFLLQSAPVSFLKFKKQFNSKNIRGNKNISNLIYNVSSNDFMNKIRAVVSDVQKSGYNSSLPNSYNIYQLIVIANASGAGRVEQFLFNKKPFGAGHLHYLKSSRFRNTLNKLRNMKPELNGTIDMLLADLPETGLGGFNKYAMLSKRSGNEFETEDKTMSGIRPDQYRFYVLIMRKFKQLLEHNNFVIAIENSMKQMFGMAKPDQSAKYYDRLITNYVINNWEDLSNNKIIDPFRDFLGKVFNIELHIKQPEEVPEESYEKLPTESHGEIEIPDFETEDPTVASLQLSKRAQYNEPGILYFPGDYAEDIKSGKRRMTIRTNDVPVNVSEVVKCMTYSGAYICDLLITSKEVMSLSRIEKAFGERVSKNLEQKFGKDARFMVIRFEANTNLADDGDEEDKMSEVLIDKDGIKLTRGQIKDHYSKPEVRKKIMARIKNEPILVYIGVEKNKNILKRNHDGEQIVITNDDIKNDENPNNYFYWIKRRLLSIHQVFGKKTNLGFIDLDLHGNFSFNEAKQYAKEVSKKIKSIFNTSPHIYQSGGSGIHIEFNFATPKDIDELRIELKEMLDEINKDWDNVSTSIIKGNGMRSDVSTLHNKGSIRVPGSLGETYGKEKKGLGQDTDDTYYNSNYGKYTNLPDNLDEDPYSLDTGAIKPSLNLSVTSTDGIGAYGSSYDELDKTYIWFWDPISEKLIYHLNQEKGKDIKKETHFSLADMHHINIMFSARDFRGYIYFYPGEKQGEVHLYSGVPERMPKKLVDGLSKLANNILPNIKINELEKEHQIELWKEQEKDRLIEKYIARREDMGLDIDPEVIKEIEEKFGAIAPDLAHLFSYSGQLDEETSNKKLQAIFKIAGIMDEEEESLYQPEEEEAGEDVAEKWLKQQEPTVEDKPAAAPHKEVKKETPIKSKRTLFDQIEGEIPERLKPGAAGPKTKRTKAPRVKKYKEVGEEDESAVVNFEELFGIPEKESVPQIEDACIKYKEALNKIDINKIKDDLKKELTLMADKLHSQWAKTDPEKLIEVILNESEYEKADKTLEEEYKKQIENLILNSINIDKDKLKDCAIDLSNVIKKTYENIIEETVKNEELKTGRNDETIEHGEQFAMDDMIILSNKEKAEIKPSFSDRIQPPTDDKGKILTSWPKIDLPDFTEEEEKYFNPNNLSSGPEMRRVFSDPRAWMSLKQNPGLLQKWILPAIIMTIGNRWFDLNSTKDSVGRKEGGKEGVSFKYLQGGAPFGMLDDVLDAEKIKQLQEGIIEISDLPEAKEYVQHINRIITNLINVYFAKENPLIPIDSYIYSALNYEMIPIIAKKHNFKRNAVPICSICKQRSALGIEIEKMEQVSKGIWKCPTCEVIVNRLKNIDLVEINKDIKNIERTISGNEKEVKSLTKQLQNEDIDDVGKEKLTSLLNSSAQKISEYNNRKETLKIEAEDLKNQIRLRSAQSNVPYFHTLCPDPKCKLQKIPLTAIDWEDSLWKTSEGDTYLEKLKKEYGIIPPEGIQNIEEIIPKKLKIPHTKSWILEIPFKCPYDGIKFKMKDVRGQGYRSMAGYFYYPWERSVWVPMEKKEKDVIENDPQYSPDNLAPIVKDLQIVADIAQNGALQQYYFLSDFIRAWNAAMKQGKTEFTFEGKIYPVKTISDKQKASFARELSLFHTIMHFAFNDTESYIRWLASSPIVSKPVYKDGKLQNQNTAKGVLSYAEKREQISLPVLQKWVDTIMHYEDYMERFGFKDWLVDVGQKMPDGTHSLDGIPSDGPGTYFISKVKNNEGIDKKEYGFTCQLQSKRLKDEKYHKYYDEKGPRILTILDVWKLDNKDMSKLTTEQKMGFDAVPKDKAQAIVSASVRDNIVKEIDTYDFHIASLGDTRLVAGDFVLVRAFIMPGKNDWSPLLYMRRVMKNERNFDFWEKFGELLHLKQDDKTYWQKFTRMVQSKKPEQYGLGAILDRELLQLKKKSSFELSKRAENTLKEYKSKRNFEETSEPDGKVEKKNKHRFVIQNHYADKAGQHYDLRLENDEGAMSSWSLPKHKLPSGKEKLLAVKVEDHPISYNKFEGEIPKGEYGAGKVEIQDNGTYEEIEWTNKKIVFKFNGKKEKEIYNLIKTDGNKWLIMKAKNQNDDDVVISKRAGHTYEAEKKEYLIDMLIELTVENKSKSVPIEDLKYNLEEAVWSDGKNKNYSPQDVLNDPKKFADEMEQIEEAELKYPIFIYKDEIVDGFHRLAKAVLKNKKTIEVKELTTKQMDAARIDKERRKKLLKASIIISKRAENMSKEEENLILLNSAIERRKLNAIMRRERRKLKELGLNPICVSSTAAQINVPGTSDIDFQIGTDNIKETCELLEKNGYKFSKELPGAFIEYTYTTPEGISVDLKVRPKSHVKWQIEGLKRILKAPKEERDAQIIKKYKALQSGDEEEYRRIKNKFYEAYGVHPPESNWGLVEQDSDDFVISKRQPKEKSYKVLYHIGKRPPKPVPFGDRYQRRPYLEEVPREGLFMTDNFLQVSMNHGKLNNVYAYKIPMWVIKEAGGLHMYDLAKEIIISKELWEKAGNEIEFLGKTMSKEDLINERKSYIAKQNYQSPYKYPGDKEFVEKIKKNSLYITDLWFKYGYSLCSVLCKKRIVDLIDKEINKIIDEKEKANLQKAKDRIIEIQEGYSEWKKEKEEFDNKKLEEMRKRRLETGDSFSLSDRDIY